MFNLKAISALALTALSLNLAADVPRDRIDRLLGEISVSVETLGLTADQLNSVEQRLQQTLDFINGSSSRWICMKQSNGRFYPAIAATGAVVGDTDYSAGYSDIKECRTTLPTAPGALTCFKRSNGRFYPTNPNTGKVVGSNDYSAGYSYLSDCLSSIQ
jgi:hypothetical protein